MDNPLITSGKNDHTENADVKLIAESTPSGTGSAHIKLQPNNNAFVSLLKRRWKEKRVEVIGNLVGGLVVVLFILVYQTTSKSNSQSYKHTPDEQSSNTAQVDQNVSNNNTAYQELRDRCVRQAKEQGYQNGQCAYGFIDTCIRTQSRSKMEEALRTDAMLGMGTAQSCPNMPSDYVADFDKLDQF